MAVTLPQSGLSFELPADDPGSEPLCPEAPPPPPPPPPRPPAPDIFGSVAMPVASTALDERWNRVRAEHVDPTDGPWAGLLLQAERQESSDRLFLVNSWVNRRIGFAEDRSSDDWATAREALSRRLGDCEDYAIAKMGLLEEAGFSPDAMYLVIVRDVPRNADHAVLAVRQEGELLILDSRTDRILRSWEVTDYRPTVSFSGPYAWTHGYRSGMRPAGVRNVARPR